jgi:hypothetical protein
MSFGSQAAESNTAEKKRKLGDLGAVEASVATEHCGSCRRGIADPTVMRLCATCKTPLHADCANRCGYYGDVNSDYSEDSDARRLPCDVVFCDAHILRQPICCYPSGCDDDSDTAEHGPGVAMCYKHIDECAYCRLAACKVHQERELGRESLKLHQCAQCYRSFCEQHALYCAEGCDPECLVCGGLKATDVTVDWSDVYGSDYLCKSHRAYRYSEAMVDPKDRPDSPEGQPMSRASRRQWALDKTDERIKYTYTRD